MEDQNILIDQLEDKLIDHPQSTGDGEESYQEKLTERASQILSGKWGLPSGANGLDNTSFYNFLLTKPVLHYQYLDYDDLRLELAEWFVSSDLLALPTIEFEEPFDMEDAFRMGFHPSLNLSRQSSQVNHLYYYILGEYKTLEDELQHLNRIELNCARFMAHALFQKVLSLFVSLLQKYITNASDYVSPSNSVDAFGINIQRLATVLYFSITVATLSNDRPASMEKIVFDSCLLEHVTKLIEVWKQYPSNTLKIRSFILLLSKLILFEFGDSAHLTKVENLLNKNTEPQKKGNTVKEALTCSPLEFFSMKEDLHDKYPLSEGLNPQDGQPLERERSEFMALNSHSSSMTNLIEAPRTNKGHTVLGQLPTQTLHISTPVSSPPTTPSDFMSGGEKIRKMYHVHQGMPLIYPYIAQQTVPQAIMEADHLLDTTAKKDYTFEQFYDERMAFMKQERGISDCYSSQTDGKFTTLTSTQMHESDLQRCKTSIERVEKFYSSCAAQLQALVEVLKCVISSNKLDVNLRDLECEVNIEGSFISKFGADPEVSNQVRSALFRKLESFKVKDTTLKAVSRILILLLKWFKTSNILKSFYFGTILVDSHYMTTFMDFISDSFNNNALQRTDDENSSLSSYDILASQNRILNPPIDLPQYDFFNYCLGKTEPPSKVRLLNRVPICRMKHELTPNGERIVNIDEFNRSYCTILTNLFSVTNELLIENMSHRIIMFNETKPTDLMKIILLNFENDFLQKPILEIFKKLTPYQGRKWRASNMDVISRVYLNLRLSLKDDWLCGKDLESDFNSCYDQELALRSLIQFYNMHHYPEQMRCLGLTLAER
ncbi:hypothetical protein PUMCH_003696 [Australozyma saopauloensis]|uniref:Factor arrest protein 11 n=1 Tax=Australozyma saopauloensis TaxID=291208 RepID=A0AAX4HCT9_9ASCO|nr:hypothetical protein PUMCH_003696 [[Candida] saopauloensis]